MNERIKELARKANMVEVEYSPGFPDIQYPKNFEKFAELIVKECIKVCAEKETAFQNESLSAQSQVGRDAWRDKRDGAGECVFGIKEHFGVEE